MATQLLAEAIDEYQQSLQGISEALEASPDEQELLELKAQLEEALLEAQAALDGLQPTDTAPASSVPANIASSTADAAPPVARPRNAVPGSNNARIHSRSKYAHQKPDFKALAARYPSMAPFLSSKGGAYDFTDPAACRELTRVLLEEDFGIQWWLPLGQLVPPVTNRVNYVHWLEDLLSLSKPEGPVTGLDIGCGANLIYPLLGATLCGWSFVGADVTPAALCWAARNLGANPQLAPLIELRRVAMQQEQQQFHGVDSSHDVGDCAAAADGGDDLAVAELAAQLAEMPEVVASAEPASVTQLEASQAAGSGIVSGAVRRGERFAFCMCNPPFFESIADAGRNPATAFGGTAAEMVYPGGELAFLTGMVQDSLRLRGAVHWYTSMVGKKGTLRAVRSMLYRHGVCVLRTTEFFQGKTSRWALAWSFTADAAAASKPLPRFPTAGSEAMPAGSQPQLQARLQPGAQAQAQAQAQAAGAAARPVGRKLSWQVHAPASASSALYNVALACLQKAGVTCTLKDSSFDIEGSYHPMAADHAPPASGDAVCKASKRQRVGDGVKGDSQTQTQRNCWQLEVHLFQQHAGLFLLTATLHKSAPDSALGWWGVLTRSLRDGLAANWKVSL